MPVLIFYGSVPAESKASIAHQAAAGIHPAGTDQEPKGLQTDLCPRTRAVLRRLGSPALSRTTSPLTEVPVLAGRRSLERAAKEVGQYAEILQRQVRGAGPLVKNLDPRRKLLILRPKRE